VTHGEKAAMNVVDNRMGTGLEAFGYKNGCFDVVGSDSLETLGLLDDFRLG
jgi:hypothetical protein